MTLIGYASVTPGEAPDQQIAALRGAGVAAADIHVDVVPTGSRGVERAPRPALQHLRTAAEPGTTLVVTELARLAANLRPLVSFGAELHAADIGLRVLTEGIDTTTAEGRAQLDLLAALDRLQRGGIAKATREGLAAARAQGRKAGRPPKLTPDQASHAQKLYDQGNHTVAEIAATLGVSRATIYGHITRPAGGPRPRTRRNAPTAPEQTALIPPPAPAAEPIEPAAETRSTPVAPAPERQSAQAPGRRRREPASSGRPWAGSRLYQHPDPSKVVRFRPRRPKRLKPCPCCQTRPGRTYSPQQMADDLTYRWLESDPDPNFAGGLIITKHCASCQPDQRIPIECADDLCENGPILGGDLAAQAARGSVPELVHRWLIAHGWRPALTGSGLLCPEHTGTDPHLG